MGCCLDYGCWCLLCFVYCVFDCVCDCCGTVSLLGCPGWLVAGFLDSAALGVCCGAGLLRFAWFLVVSWIWDLFACVLVLALQLWLDDFWFWVGAI